MSMMARAGSHIRLGIAIAVLSILALGSLWVLQVLRYDTSNDFAARPSGKPDYYLNNFSYVKMNVNGQPRYDITGVEMRHFPITDSYTISSPVLTSLATDQPPMTIRSERALIEDNSSKVHLYENVNADRSATAKTEHLHLTSDYLLFLPDENIVKTDKPVQIRLGNNSTMNGIGMIANNATQQLRLLNSVRSHYVDETHAGKNKQTQ